MRLPILQNHQATGVVLHIVLLQNRYCPSGHQGLIFWIPLVGMFERSHVLTSGVGASI
jgi:hypothetical protein